PGRAAAPSATSRSAGSRPPRSRPRTRSIRADHRTVFLSGGVESRVLRWAFRRGTPFDPPYDYDPIKHQPPSPGSAPSAIMGGDPTRYDAGMTGGEVSS